MALAVLERPKTSAALPALPAVPGVPILRLFDIIVICSSAGKDSMALMARVAEEIKAQGWTGRVVVVHNDLGVTDSGESVEWDGVAELAAEHAAMYGFEFVAVSRELGGLWDQLLYEREMWMSSAARWCTSDQKTAQGMKLVTALVAAWRAETGITDRPAEVLYCLGLRGEESDTRAKKPALEVDESHSSGKRRITRWLPIKDWTIKQVWDQIKAAGMRPHAAYAKGMTRLSCSLCVLASIEDLFLAGALRPALLADYARAERRIGHSFRQDISIAEIVAGLRFAALEAEGSPDAAEALEGLRALAYVRVRRIRQAATDKAAAARAKDPTKRDVPMWPFEKIEASAAKQVARFVAAARRAHTLATGPEAVAA